MELRVDSEAIAQHPFTLPSRSPDFRQIIMSKYSFFELHAQAFRLLLQIEPGPVAGNVNTFHYF
ncbi:hypothetical protein D3C86_2177000 [compost metagenome]